MKLFVAQFGFEPIECVVSAHALSGLIEKRELAVSETRVKDFVQTTGEAILKEPRITGTVTANSFSGSKQSTSKKNVSAQPVSNMKEQTSMSNKIGSSATTGPRADPVTSVLSTTFHSPDLTGALDRVVRKARSVADKKPMLSHDPSEAAEAVYGNKPQPPVSRVTAVGPGSGAVFDAGAEWISRKHKKDFNASNTQSLLPEAERERIVEGVTIPNKLDSTTAVNFVLTQEAGKLKPKDLKVAIENSRATREKRSREQQTIRLQSGAGQDGTMDLEGLLAEENLNAEEGSAYKRQLRELAFLSELEEVRKRESEKEFRVSEEYIGVDPVTLEEVEALLERRREIALLQRQNEWKKVINRRVTEKFPAHHPKIKSGISPDVAIVLGILPPNKNIENVANQPGDLQTLPEPSYDTNLNDIWSKRVNSVRSLMNIVSKYIICERVRHRLQMLHNRLESANARTREQVRDLVEKDNLAQGQGKRLERPQSPSRPKSSAGRFASFNDTDQPANTKVSAALLACSMPDPLLPRRKALDESLAQVPYELELSMLRRVLFPKFVSDESASRLQLSFGGLDEDTNVFDDRTFFPLKVRPEYLTLGYTEQSVPSVPLHYPRCSHKSTRKGAIEELFLRAPTDLQTQPSATRAESDTTVKIQASADKSPETDESSSEIETDTAPDWLVSGESTDIVFRGEERDFFRPRHEMRMYMMGPKRKETDVDWILRPHASVLRYQPANKIRDRLLREPGFNSANTYLLAGQASRFLDDPQPTSGPSLIASYLPDMDRHASGLSCYAQEQFRRVTQPDLDLGPIRRKQDREDVLTDSESDEEDPEPKPRPSLEMVRSFLSRPAAEEAPQTKPAGKGKGKADAPKAGKAAAASVAVAVPPAEDASQICSVTDERKRGQVDNLMRDRKLLEQERMLLKTRREEAETFSERITAISKTSRCCLQAVSIQLPFHKYEEEVLALVEPRMPKPTKIFSQH